MRNQESGIRNQVKCYVINLDRSKDRLEHITRIFDEQGLVFERIAAVDGRLLSDIEFNHLTSKRNWPHELTHNEVGCFLSHRECLRLIAESDELWGAIFEDDIILSPNIHSFLQNPDWIPEGTNIAKLDTAKINCAVKYPSHINIIGTSTHYQCARLISKHYCTGGYIISRECAKKLYELTEYVTAPIDEIYFNPDYGFLKKINIQQIIPALVVQETEMESTIKEQRKIIKRKDRSLMTRIRREIQRTYRRHILLSWLALAPGCQVGKIPFK